MSFLFLNHAYVLYTLLSHTMQFHTKNRADVKEYAES